MKQFDPAQTVVVLILGAVILFLYGLRFFGGV
jgi:hypothetical protein